MPLEPSDPVSVVRRPRLLTPVAALCLLLAQGPGAAEGRLPEERIIELRDGSVLRGEVVGAGGGHYRIRTPALGEIELSDAQVLAIRSAAAPEAGAAAASAGSGDLPGVMSGIQQQLLGDPTLMSAITALQDDPELRAALADPAFTQLILSGNVAALGADPRFLRLMANPAILSLLGQVSASAPPLGR